MKAVIPLAGKGKRLRPHTHAIPKPLVQVAGKTVLGHILEKLAPLGITEVELVVGHLNEKIEEYVTKEYPQFTFRLTEQKELKGTADAIKMIEPYVSQDILIIFADTISDADYSIITDLPQDAAGILWVKEVERYQDFGVVITDEQGYMRSIVEKPQEPVSKLANIGLYYIRDWKLLFEGIDHVLQSPPGPGGEFFLTDAFQYMIDKGARIKTETVDVWLDCGQPKNLIDTNRYLLSNGHGRKPDNLGEGIVVNDPVRIEDGVVLENSTVGPNVTLAKGAIVKNSSIKDSIVGIDTLIESSNLRDSLIGNEVIIKGAEGMLNVYDHSAVVNGEE